MKEQKFAKRSRHNEELLFEELSGAIETIDAVAEATGKTFDQVVGVYRSQAINRLTEVLIDAGDELDDHLNDIKSFITKELDLNRNWYFDNQPLQIEIHK